MLRGARACSPPGTATSRRCSRAVATPRRSRRVDRRREVRAGRAGARPSFAHASEAELARILDFYEVRWAYEPDTFPIGWNLDGDVVESFSPDFYLPDLDLYVELTTLKQKLVRKKNRKLRRLRELYPDVRIKLFYARDFRVLLLKFGRMALVDELTGTTGQSTPPRAVAEAAAMPRIRPSIRRSPRCSPSVRPTRSCREVAASWPSRRRCRRPARSRPPCRRSVVAARRRRGPSTAAGRGAAADAAAGGRQREPPSHRHARRPPRRDDRHHPA